MSYHFPPGTLKEYIRAYAIYGARSPEKLKPVHGEIAARLKSEITRLGGVGYSTAALGDGDTCKEIKVPGLFYDKNSDITVLKNGKPCAVVSAKFPVSNFSQNANNYFEGMLGETANIRLNEIAVAHVLILPYKLPYYKNATSESDKVIAKIESIQNSHLDKYRLLMSKESTVRPDAFLIALVQYGVEEHYEAGVTMGTISNRIVNSDIVPCIFDQNLIEDKMPHLSDANKEFIAKYSDYRNFIDTIANKALNSKR